MPTLDMDNYEEEQTEYVNFAYFVEEKILRWFGKGSIYEVDIKVRDIDNEIYEHVVRIYALDKQSAIEKAKVLGKTMPLTNTEDSDVGFIFPKKITNKKRSAVKRKGITGFVVKYADAVKNKTKTATFQDGVPKPLSLTRAHISSMLASRKYETIDEADLDHTYVSKYANRCLLVLMMWIFISVVGVAVFFAGLHPKHSEKAILGLLNPFTVFGVIAITISVLGSIHSLYSRRNAICWLSRNGE